MDHQCDGYTYAGNDEWKRCQDEATVSGLGRFGVMKACLTHRNEFDSDRCDSCEEVMVQGVRCHETECPNAN